MDTELKELWEKGACNETTFHLFFGPDRERASARLAREEKAKAVCNGCPMQSLCYEYAAMHGEYGIWGGTTEDERAGRQPQAKTCGACKKAFRPIPATRAYCSTDCEKEGKRVRERVANYERRTGIRNPRELKRGETTTVGICVVCGSAFERATVARQVCGDECKQARKQQQQKDRSKHRKSRLPRTDVECSLCERRFVSDKKNVKYCSETCRKLARSARTRQWKLSVAS